MKHCEWILFYIIAAAEQKTVARFLFIDSSQRQMIRGALSHWSEQTCVRFKELGVHEDFEGHHVQFTSRHDGYVVRY